MRRAIARPRPTPESLAPGGAAPVTVEDVRQVTRGDAGAAVANADSDRVLRPSTLIAFVQPAARRAVPDRETAFGLDWTVRVPVVQEACDRVRVAWIRPIHGN
jgi:hypothetical protein